MTTTAATATRPVEATTAPGLALALVSAAAFGLAGPMARSLLDLGWTPAAVVSLRVGGGFVLLLVPCLVLLRRTGLPTRAQLVRVIGFGVTAIAGAQLCFFSAVQYLPVGTALMLEYTAPLLLIGWHWVVRHRPPNRPVVVGAIVAILGLVLVLDPQGSLSPLGVLWGLGAALCLAAYFALSEDTGARPVHPLLLTTVGCGVGAAVILAVSAAGVLPFAITFGDTAIAGHVVAWWLPLGVLICICVVLAYLTGIAAVRRLGSSVASFVGLSEVLFAVLFAALLVGQRPGPPQLVGGILVLAGIALVQRRSA